MAIDQSRLEELLGRFVNDFGAAGFVATVVIGDKFGRSQALATGPATTADLADRTSTNERYVADWLAAQAASGYATYDPDGGQFSLSEERPSPWPTRTAPCTCPAPSRSWSPPSRTNPRSPRPFRSGTGVGWHEHHPDLFAGAERFFRPGYAANLVSGWIPALDGVQTKLEAGARVADMSRPLVHRMVHMQDRPGFQGGSEWACPFCPQQVVYWPLHHKVLVIGQADALHVRAIQEVPVHLDDLVVELTEADETWLTVHAIAWSGVVAR